MRKDCVADKISPNTAIPFSVTMSTEDEAKTREMQDSQDMARDNKNRVDD